MKTILFLTMAFAQIKPMIVGGNPAPVNKYSFNASLRDNNYGHFCGGSLISEKYVLTAAHCVESGVNYIVIGANKLSDNLHKYAIKRIITHPNWNGDNMDYDFALIELTEKAKESPVSLSTRKRLFKNDMAEIIGFGYLKENGKVSNQLMTASVPLVSLVECKAAYPNKITSTMICAGNKKGGVDTCQGDSGGPLLLNGQLIGLTSWGEGCARPNKYGVYSNVYMAYEWILTNIK